MAKAYSLADIQTLLLDNVAATDDMPFGPDVIVYRVCGKMFALLAWTEEPMSVNLKCDPLQADMLRAQYPGIKPGYHMNKKHWNTVTLDGSIARDLLKQMIAQSYELVVKGLKKPEREALKSGQNSASD